MISAGSVSLTLLYKQQTHRGRRSAEHRELHAVFLKTGTERWLVGELEVAGRLSHEHVVVVSYNPLVERSGGGST